MPNSDVMQAFATETAATTAMVKLEELFNSLRDEERAVISEMVHASLVHAASSRTEMPEYAKGLTGRTAPSLVESVSVPGSVRGYSNVNCGEFLLRES
jgi:hypothetical protein